MSFFSLFKGKYSNCLVLLAMILLGTINANQFTLDLSKEEKETLEKAIEAATVITIVLIVVGALVFISICICIACLIYRRRRQHERFNEEIELNRRNYQHNSPPQYYTPQYPTNPVGPYPQQYN